MTTQSVHLSKEVHSYLVAHSTPLDAIAQELMEETRNDLPDDVKMQVAPEQAGFLTMITKLIGARQAVEVGTFTGMSSLAIARGLSDGGSLTCFDVSPRFTAVAQRYWQRAGVADRIRLVLGPAAENLRALPARPHLDLVFIDADKEGYLTYWRELVPRVRRGGLILVDNVLWDGRVADPSVDDAVTSTIRRFNQEVLTDERVDVVMLPVADGLTLARRR